MTKKISLIIIALLATLFFSSSVFATNTIEDGARDIGTEVKDSWDKLDNTAENLGNNAKGAVDNMGDNIKNMMNNNDDDNGRDNNDYTATRTSAMTATNGGLFGLNSTAWTWLVLAVLGVAIVALVWYYGAQQTNNK